MILMVVLLFGALRQPLIDQIDLDIGSGKDPMQAVVDSSVGRVRPVSMAAVTTVLGMTPLLFDAFFASMAVLIMFGLSFATLLTLYVVPILYTLLFKISPVQRQLELPTNDN